MPVPLFQFLQAKDLVSLTLYPGSVNLTTGVVTWGTGVDIALAAGLGTFQGITWNFSPEMMPMAPADAGINSYAIEIEDWTATITEFIPKNGVGALVSMAGTTDYFKVVALYRPRGASTGGTYLGFAGVRAGGNSQIQRGPNSASLNLQPIGVGIYFGTTAPTF